MLRQGFVLLTFANSKKKGCTFRVIRKGPEVALGLRAN